MTDGANTRGIKKLLLWLVAVCGGFPLNTHRDAGPVFRKTSVLGRGRRENAFAALVHNVGLMDEAVARYQAIMAAHATWSGVEAATALRKTYQKTRAGFNVVETGAMPNEVADKGALLHEIFHEVSLLCRAADMSGLLGGTDFGAGFEHLTALYQPGANMFQPEAVTITPEILAEFNDGVAHYNEVKTELDDLVNYYVRKF